MGFDESTRYLLIAGYADRRRGRPDHRVSVFADADQARDEFRRLHQPRSAAVWAEVVAVDVVGRMAPVCRFGADQRPEHRGQVPTNRSASSGAAPTWRWT
jgi:hypothetical protein